MLDQQVIKARRVRDGYLEHNKGTVERPVRIDSKTVIYQKVKIDEAASNFAESLKKMEQQERIDKNVSKPVKAPKVSKAKENKVKRASIVNSRRTQIYEMYEMGKPAPAIGEFFKLSVKTIRTEISKYRKINGIEFNRPECETYQQVKELYNGKEFLNMTQIAKLLGKSRGTIAFHIDKIRESGETDRVKVKLNK